MGYCPTCGSKVHHNEVFCVNCGQKLPTDIADRLERKKWRVKYFTIPIILMLIMITISVAIYTHSRYQVNSAKTYYQEAEEALLLSDYHLANEQIKKAIDIYPTFSEARRLNQFTDFAVKTVNSLENANSDQEKLQLILQAKNKLTHYSGEAIDSFKDQLINQQNTVQLAMVQKRLDSAPSIDDLPALLWEAESINDPEAYEIVRIIRDRLIIYSTDEAYALMKQNQFTLARSLIEISLYYLPNNEKLMSLLNAIEKEKEAFESAQEARLELALSQYEAELEKNENAAIENLQFNFNLNSQGNLMITGEITSAATVPIHAVQIHYSVLDSDGSEIDTHEIYVYPETLYPGETGRFDHIHFDNTLIRQTEDVVITSITWLLD